VSERVQRRMGGQLRPCSRRHTLTHAATPTSPTMHFTSGILAGQASAIRLRGGARPSSSPPGVISAPAPPLPESSLWRMEKLVLLGMRRASRVGLPEYSSSHSGRTRRVDRAQCNPPSAVQSSAHKLSIRGSARTRVGPIRVPTCRARCSVCARVGRGKGKSRWRVAAVA